jgi:homoserine kinase
MKILGIGDSFMDGSRASIPPNYLHIVAESLNAEYEMYGMSGSGPWNAFFKIV